VPPSGSSRRAVVSLRLRRSVSAWALPPPSATASAKLANSTVAHNHSVTSPTNRSGRAKNSIVVITLPISTTNMTGILTISRGSSFTKARSTARRKIAGSSSAAAGRFLTLTGRGPEGPASPGGTPIAEAVTASGPGR
jgi:hypothetical protein